MATKKSAEEKQSKTVTYRIVPYFAVEFGDDRLKGTRATGKTPGEALACARGITRAMYPFAKYDVVEVIKNPEALNG